MTNSLIYDESLKNFIENIGLASEDKDDLLSKMPQMDEEERTKLFKTLTKIYLLDLEEEEAKQKIRKFWQK
ncbi:MAG: hypothetical protein ABH919_01365 [bacterium]